MVSKAVKIRLKGHESFYIREGWIRKGITAIVKEPGILAASNAIDELGVGSNMVKSIRYWLQVLGLTEEVRLEGSKRGQVLTEEFGRILFDKDSYFEDDFSLALMHYKLVTNIELATSWYLFFNKVGAKEFTKINLINIMEQQIRNLDTSIQFSMKSLIDDCTCIVKTYSFDKEDLKKPEDNLISPFTELGLLSKVKGKEEILLKTVPKKDKLDKLAILYVMVDRLQGATSTTIDKLIEEDCNVGKVFNLDRNILNEYLDELEDCGFIKINRTAGLNTVYINEINTKDILEEYFKGQ